MRNRRRRIFAYGNIMGGSGRTFYVDFTAGADINSGLSPSSPWKTITKINTFATYQPGDTILLKRGETWTGIQLTIPTNNLTFGAYGIGAKPIIDGNDVVECIQANTKHHLRFSNINCLNGVNSGLQFINTTHDIIVIDCDSDGHGNDGVIFLDGCYNGYVSGGEFKNGWQSIAGFNVSGIEIADNCHDIIIDGAICHDMVGTVGVYATGVGITIHSHGGDIFPWNITIRDCEFYNNSGYGIQILKQDNTVDALRNIRVENCYSHNNYEGLHLYKAAAATAYPNGIVIALCHFELNTLRALYMQGDNIEYHNNVSEGGGQIVECKILKFYNNTLYYPNGGGTYPIYFTAVRTDQIYIKNNIVYTQVVGGMCIGVDVSIVGIVDIDYNLYFLLLETTAALRWHWRGTAYNWANWLINSAQDVNSPLADQNPLFVNPAVNDFTLQAGSPAINAGVDVGLPFLGIAPDCGAFEKV